MQVVGRARHELRHEVEVERSRLVGLGVDEQASAADLVTDVEQPGDRVDEQSCPEAAVLVGQVDPEPRQQCDRLWVAPGAATHAVGGGTVVELRDYPSVSALAVKRVDGSAIEVPLVEAYVDRIDTAAKLVVLHHTDEL